MPGQIFISYARKDDQSAQQGAKGLVTALHDRLLAEFNDLGHPQPTVFQDTKQIGSNQQFEDRLGKALVSASMLVVVLSRNWLSSDWCQRELAAFVAHWRARGDDAVHLKERIFVVHKHAIDPAQRPAWLQGQSGFELLTVDPENQDEVEYFDTALGRPVRDEWFTTIRKLAKGLRRRLLGEPLEPAQPEQKPAGERARLGDVVIDLTVYLAWPAHDMETSRNRLVQELKRRRVRIVPDTDEPLSTVGDLARARIAADLAQADLSIHLLGERAGFHPEDAPPIVRLQLGCAAERVGSATGAGRTPFHRIMWAPKVMPGADGAAMPRDLMAVLAQHAGSQGSAGPESGLMPTDKLDGDTLTKFTQFVLQHLDEVSRPAPADGPSIGAGAQVYVQHDENDTQVADQVADGLQRLGYQPLLPLVEGDVAGRQQFHRENLRQADAVLFCWAQAAPVWVRAQARELREWRELGRAQAFSVRSVLSLPPGRVDKDRLRRFPPREDIDLVLDATTLASLGPVELDPILRQLPGGPP